MCRAPLVWADTRGSEPERFATAYVVRHVLLVSLGQHRERARAALRFLFHFVMAMLDIDWELMFRYCGQECSPEERARFERWLDADARHREFFDAVVRGAWRTLAPEPTPPAMRAVAPRAQARPAFRWAWRVSLTAAAVVALAFGLRRSGLFASSAPVAQRERTLSTRAGERAQLALADGTRITLAPASTIRYWA